MPRREISLSRAVAPIYGAPHRIRTFHADCQSRRPGVESGQFTLDKVVMVTLPLIRTGAGPVIPTIEVKL